MKIERYHRIRRRLAPKEDGGDGLTVQEVADLEGISRQRVRQIADGPEPRKPGRPWDRR